MSSARPHPAVITASACRQLLSLRPRSPVATARWLRLAHRQGANLSTLVAWHACRTPAAPAVIDDQGTLSHGELERRSRHLAGYLQSRHGLGPGRSLGILCRNHRGFVVALLAGSRLGADLVFLNTDFPGPQLAQVLERHAFTTLIHDAEFSGVLDSAGYRGPRITAGPGTEMTSGTRIESATACRIEPAPGRVRPGRLVLLTSGTTGTPKGAPRQPKPLSLLGPAVSLLGLTPLQPGKPLLVAPPLFHGFGLAFGITALVLGMPLVLQHRFDPEQTLALIDRHRVQVAVAVPVMLQRILDLPGPVLARAWMDSLAGMLAAAAPLGGPLATRWMDRFGDRLYNLYGSSEAGFGTLATPADLRAAPGTVGSPPLGVRLRILGTEGQELPPGAIGHIAIRSGMLFEGYVGGGDKQRWQGYLNTGDLGHVDAGGHVYVDGREDDMIVSGGENVFPQEVADTLLAHDGVADAAVFGVPDEEFGQRLKAFVVPRTALDDADLKAWLKTRIARYKVPREIIFLENLPRNPGGKVLKRELALD